MTDLNNLINSTSGWTLGSACGINDLGQIVGYGLNSLGQNHAFLLTPIPEPSTFALLDIGLISFIAFAWRRRSKLRKPKIVKGHECKFLANCSFPKSFFLQASDPALFPVVTAHGQSREKKMTEKKITPQLPRGFFLACVAHFPFPNLPVSHL